jgi:hypothetical protein
VETTMATYRVFKKDSSGDKSKEGSYDNRLDAELRFVDVVAYTVSNFDEYECADIDAIIEQGYERFGAGTIWIEEDGVRPVKV